MGGSAMKTAIVGGGVGGLITALLLTKQGTKVEIFEKESRLGGRLAFVERNGYRIDEGPTIVLLPEMLTSILEEAGISSDQYELIQCDPLYSLNYPDGTVYTKYASLSRQLEEIKRVFPGEEEHFIQFMEDMKTRFSIGKRAFLEKDFVHKRDFWTLENLKNLWKLKAYQTVHSMTASHFNDSRLQEAYSLQTLYVGGNPYSSPAMYSLIPYSEHEHGIYYLKGGYASLVEVLERELRRRNVPIHLNHKVDKLMLHGNRAQGIIANGKKRLFHSVILNGDFPKTASVIDKQEKSYIPSSGCVLFYFGLNRRYDQGNIHQFFMSPDFHHHMKQVFKSKEIPDAPSFYAFNPSKIDPTLAPEGKSVLYVLVPVPSGTHIDWSKQEAFKEKMLQEIEERAFPGIKEATEWMEIRTPNEAERFGLYQGGSFGIAPELRQSGVFRPQVKPYSYDNVFAVGASVHPGGGIPIVMQGAKLLADYIAREKHAIMKGGTIHEVHRESIPTV